MTGIKFYFGKSDTNKHGTEKPGEKWDMQTVRGPRFKIVRLGYKPRFGGWRLIFYFPSGAWWYFDVYGLKSYIIAQEGRMKKPAKKKRLCVYYNRAWEWQYKPVEWIVCKQCQRLIERGMIDVPAPEISK